MSYQGDFDSVVTVRNDLLGDNALITSKMRFFTQLDDSLRYSLVEEPQPNDMTLSRLASQNHLMIDHISSIQNQIKKMFNVKDHLKGELKRLHNDNEVRRSNTPSPDQYRIPMSLKYSLTFQDENIKPVSRVSTQYSPPRTITPIRLNTIQSQHEIITDFDVTMSREIRRQQRPNIPSTIREVESEQITSTNRQSEQPQRQNFRITYPVELNSQNEIFLPQPQPQFQSASKNQFSIDLTQLNEGVSKPISQIDQSRSSVASIHRKQMDSIDQLISRNNDRLNRMRSISKGEEYPFSQSQSKHSQLNQFSSSQSLESDLDSQPIKIIDEVQPVEDYQYSRRSSTKTKKDEDLLAKDFDSKPQQIVLETQKVSPNLTQISKKTIPRPRAISLKQQDRQDEQKQGGQNQTLQSTPPKVVQPPQTQKYLSSQSFQIFQNEPSSDKKRSYIRSRSNIGSCDIDSDTFMEDVKKNSVLKNKLINLTKQIDDAHTIQIETRQFDESSPKRNSQYLLLPQSQKQQTVDRSAASKQSSFQSEQKIKTSTPKNQTPLKSQQQIQIGFQTPTNQSAQSEQASTLQQKQQQIPTQPPQDPPRHRQEQSFSNPGQFQPKTDDKTNNQTQTTPRYTDINIDRRFSQPIPQRTDLKATQTTPINQQQYQPIKNPLYEQIYQKITLSNQTQTTPRNSDQLRESGYTQTTPRSKQEDYPLRMKQVVHQTQTTPRAQQNFQSQVESTWDLYNSYSQNIPQPQTQRCSNHTQTTPKRMQNVQQETDQNQRINTETQTAGEEDQLVKISEIQAPIERQQEKSSNQTQTTPKQSKQKQKQLVQNYSSETQTTPVQVTNNTTPFLQQSFSEAVQIQTENWGQQMLGSQFNQELLAIPSPQGNQIIDPVFSRVQQINNRIQQINSFTQYSPKRVQPKNTNTFQQQFSSPSKTTQTQTDADSAQKVYSPQSLGYQRLQIATFRPRQIIPEIQSPSQRFSSHQNQTQDSAIQTLDIIFAPTEQRIQELNNQIETLKLENKQLKQIIDEHFQKKVVVSSQSSQTNPQLQAKVQVQQTQTDNTEPTLQELSYIQQINSLNHQIQQLQIQLRNTEKEQPVEVTFFRQRENQTTENEAQDKLYFNTLFRAALEESLRDLLISFDKDLQETFNFVNQNISKVHERTKKLVEENNKIGPVKLFAREVYQILNDLQIQLNDRKERLSKNVDYQLSQDKIQYEQIIEQLKQQIQKLSSTNVDDQSEVVAQLKALNDKQHQQLLSFKEEILFLQSERVSLRQQIIQQENIPTSKASVTSGSRVSSKKQSFCNIKQKI